jgi:anti-anti-sigma regulatory factor
VRRELRCRVRHSASGDRIEVSGALTASSQQRVVDALWRRAWARSPHITIDLTDLTFFEGDAVMVLLGNKRILERQRGCSIDLCGLETATRRILALN